MNDITQLLHEARDGDPAKLATVFEALYPELKRLASWRAASQRQGSTLDTTVLVHETYLKLARSSELDLRDRRHFFACAGRAMRQIVVDHARAMLSGKRGGGALHVELGEGAAASHSPADWIDLDRALGALDAIDPGQRELVELRYFAGLGREEVADLLGCSARTVERNWAKARAFLHAQLAAGGA